MATIPINMIDFQRIGERDRGSLTFVEGNTHIPFDIKRVFWIYNVPDDVVRGGHAHKDCEQVMIAVSGYVTVEADGKTVVLRDPSMGLYIPPGVSVRMYGFDLHCVLMVLCSHHFSEEDYVRTVEG